MRNLIPFVDQQSIMGQKKTQRRRQKREEGGAGTGAVPGGGRGKGGLKVKHKKFPFLQFVGVLAIAVIFPQAARFIEYGPTAILGHNFFDLQRTPSEWRSIIDGNGEGEEVTGTGKTILTIGGPHRSGTTLVWESVSAHPEISGFGSTFRTGVSFSEGILLQEVFPKFGVATELVIKEQEGYTERMTGVGKFALAKEAEVHLTEDDERVTEDNLAKLLNRYGAYWNLTQPVWVDKSPPAAVISRALQALYGLEVEGTDPPPSRSPTPSTKFLFTTRNPIANAYAHHHLLGGSDVVPFDLLLQNYVKVHSYLMEDLPHLKNGPKLIRLEDFVADPAAHLIDIFTWLGVDASPDTVERVIESVGGSEGIRTEVNAKYMEKWCTIDAWKRDKVEKRYQPQIDELGLDYNLIGSCKKAE